MTTTNRLEYLDSLRGVAILFVIYYHLIAYGNESHSLINEYVVRMRMPLFFFIGGFFATFFSFDKTLYIKRIKNRLTKQLYPTLIIWTIFIIVSWFIGGASLKEYVLHGIYDPAKRGYWFTISLVEVYLIYAIVSYYFFRYGVDLKIQAWIYLTISLVLGALFLCFFNSYMPEGRILQIYSVLSLSKLTNLIPFFYLGIFFRIYEERLFKLIGNIYSACILLVLFYGCCVFDNKPGEFETTLYYVSRLTGLLAVLSVFTCMKHYFTVNTIVGRYLIRIGQKTLPIYLFHFFLIILIPFFLRDYKDYLMIGTVLELPVILLWSAVIAEICLSVDKMLQWIPSCHKLIFNPLELKRL